MSAYNIKKAPAPWTCTGQVYAIYFCTRPGSTAAPADVAFAPLERASYFASSEAGRFCGGLGGFMVIRYTESPVGPYDELLVIPGAYTYDSPRSPPATAGKDEGKQRGGAREKKNPRITRIYVSQRDTLFNRRHNWNIPKHLARFEWRDLPGGATQVQVFPYDDDFASLGAKTTPTAEVDAPTSGGTSSPRPFFQASFKTIPYVPSFPLSTHWAKYAGVDTTLVQPPVPSSRQAAPAQDQGQLGQNEDEDQVVVVGTEKWCRCVVAQSSSRSHVGWFDLSQRPQPARGDEAEREKSPPAVDSSSSSLFENFWPGMGRWQLGIRMDDAKIEIPEGEFWERPRASL